MTVGWQGSNPVRLPGSLPSQTCDVLCSESPDVPEWYTWWKGQPDSPLNAWLVVSSIVVTPRHRLGPQIVSWWHIHRSEQTWGSNLLQQIPVEGFLLKRRLQWIQQVVYISTSELSFLFTTHSLPGNLILNTSNCVCSMHPCRNGRVHFYSWLRCAVKYHRSNYQTIQLSKSFQHLSNYLDVQLGLISFLGL